MRYLIPSLCLRARLMVCLLVVFAVLTGNVQAHRARPTLVTPQNNPVINAATSRILDLAERNGRVKVWVFFTDKGVFNDQDLSAAVKAHAPKITARAARRRAKVGITQPVFVDLPLVDSYVTSVTESGGTLRRVSRWLNAASFEIDRAALGEIAALPFVRSIRPVIRHRPPRVEITDQPLYKPSEPVEPGPLDYGPSSNQITMINVAAAHTAGYDGSGVLVCMMDTGFRKDHTAFADAYAEGRVLDEYDFIFDDGNTQDEGEDVAGQHNHGTLTWSTLGGVAPGDLYGPAYKADFILAKTEDMRSETQVEEDNWVAGMEWADAHGADVISSSLSYSDWYTAEDYDGNTCVTTIAADIAASLGIVVCNSNGNSGPSPSTIGAPADADTILAVGAVTAGETIASFSSRGPTFDGRIKPEVCAQGVSTRCASASSTTSFSYASGTSLSCPLLGGAAALVIQAHPDWTAAQVREALMQTADRASGPDNAYGWGIIDVMAAINYNNPCHCGVWGDVNDDGQINAVDVTFMVNYVYLGHDMLVEPPNCPLSAGDANCDGARNPVDVVFYVNYVYLSNDKFCADPCE